MRPTLAGRRRMLHDSALWPRGLSCRGRVDGMGLGWLGLPLGLGVMGEARASLLLLLHPLLQPLQGCELLIALPLHSDAQGYLTCLNCWLQLAQICIWG